jgi:TonB family protein
MRRRQKNTLLPKMIGVAVLLNAALLPILAKLGVFKTKHEMLVPIQLVKLPPEKKPKIKAPDKKRQVAKAKPRPAGRQEARRGPVRVNANQVHIALSKSAADDGNGATQGTLAPGTIPQAPASPPPPVAPPPVAPPPPVVAAAPPPPVVPPAPPPAPVLVAAEPVDKPQPELPSDLLDSDLNTACTILFKVHSDGTADATLVTGTGKTTLDSLALDAARRWTFHPALENGAPIESYLRLRVEFEVS